MEWNEGLFEPKVKHREYFRPFAPVVTEEMAFKIFDLKQISPYMLLACNVKDEFTAKIPSVTHIDQTARVQTINKTQEQIGRAHV